jgi:hypothetical protein
MFLDFDYISRALTTEQRTGIAVIAMFATISIIVPVVILLYHSPDHTINPYCITFLRENGLGGGHRELKERRWPGALPPAVGLARWAY